jgi:predicted O-methyltransferase YrrM
MNDLRIEIDGAGRFTFGGESFVVHEGRGTRRRSDSTAFTIVKGSHYFDFYCNLARSFRPKAILELGIFQGGSFVFLDKLFAPEVMAAVDAAPGPVAPLAAYVEQVSGRYVNFRTLQEDRPRLKQIVDEQLGGRLDLVCDDASHDYARTKDAFDALFPMLSPGGVYVIEDWGWAHAEQFQGPDALWRDRHALSNLLFEQLMLLASVPNTIDEIQVRKGAYAIFKSRDPGTAGRPVPWDKVRLRGRQYTLI